MLDLEHLRSRLLDAEDELYRIQMANNYCMTDGSYARAESVAASLRKQVAEAELALAMSDPSYHRVLAHPEARA